MSYNEQASIKDWQVEDRPREKIIHRGIEAVSEAELIGVLLGSGHRTASAVDLGRTLIQTFGSLSRLSRASVEDLVRVKGIGKAKAAQLIAAFELGRRKDQSEFFRLKFEHPGQIAAYLSPKIGDLHQEALYLMCMDTHNQLLGEKLMFLGGLNNVSVDCRLIFEKALTFQSSRIVIAHNHPSGNPAPSQADIDLTRKIFLGGTTLDIELQDHLIVTSGNYYSFRAGQYWDRITKGR